MTLNERRAPLSALMTELSFPADAIPTLLDAYDRIASTPEAAALIEGDLALYEREMKQDYGAFFEDAKKAGALCGVHEYTAKLLLLVAMALRLRGYYREAGIDDGIFLNTMDDLRCKLLECMAVKGICGTFVASWFPRFYYLDRFGLGRFQYEIIRLGREYEKNGVKLTPDSPVLNIHIPRNLQPMSPELVDGSLSRAAAFYRERLGEAPIAFVCESWLLYGGHEDFLPPHSNILAFARRFDLLWSRDNDPGKHPDLWRLFDCDYNGDPDSLPADSSLRRAYIKRLKEGKPTGEGFGIFLYEG